MGQLPENLARLGIKVLHSKPLRRLGNLVSYADLPLYATEDAMLVGRLHTREASAEDAALDFMLSGGFSPSDKVMKSSRACNY